MFSFRTDVDSSCRPASQSTVPVLALFWLSATVWEVASTVVGGPGLQSEFAQPLCALGRKTSPFPPCLPICETRLWTRWCPTDSRISLLTDTVQVHMGKPRARQGRGGPSLLWKGHGVKSGRMQAMGVRGLWSRPWGWTGAGWRAERTGRKGLGLGLIIPRCFLSGSWFCSQGPPYCAFLPCHSSSLCLSVYT